jgi:hypothetical protein
MSEQQVQPVEKPKRKYTKKSKAVESTRPSSARDFFREIVSELKASSEPPPPEKPKKKRVLSEKQLETLAKGRVERLEKLKTSKTKNK